MSVTVIMPVYNGVLYLRDSVGSVVRQTVPPTELIIVDDGSADDSFALAESLPTPFTKRVLRKPNGGQSAARNFAAERAAGRYLAFLDHDDIWHPAHLQRLVAPLEFDPMCGWAYSDIDEMDHDCQLVHLNLLRTLNPGVQHPKTSLYNLLAADMFIFPSAAVVRAEAFHAVGGFDERLAGYEDDDLFLRLFRAGWGNAFIPDALVRYRRHFASSAFSERMWRSRDIYAQKLIDSFPDDRDFVRYWVRDLIAPRFYRSVLDEYLRHVSRQRYDLCYRALDGARRYSALSHPTLRRRVYRWLLFQAMAFPRLFGMIYPLFREDPRFR
jgi:glycosyltransferase involved in cell wall biosynthesis